MQEADLGTLIIGDMCVRVYRTSVISPGGHPIQVQISHRRTQNGRVIYLVVFHPFPSFLPSFLPFLSRDAPFEKSHLGIDILLFCSKVPTKILRFRGSDRAALNSSSETRGMLTITIK